jgi:hypothetical protein
VTSREALHVRGEHLFSVPPLSLPRAAPGHRSAAELAGCEAVQLFVERAQAVRADFRLTDENAAAVAEICQRLDGLPLAIELATARINLFSPEALRDRLGSRLALLRGGARHLPARQQTLRATIEWSFQLLEPGEQRLLELLSAFASTGFEAVKVVAGNIEWLTETGSTSSTAWLPCWTRASSGRPTRERRSRGWCWDPVPAGKQLWGGMFHDISVHPCGCSATPIVRSNVQTTPLRWRPNWSTHSRWPTGSSTLASCTSGGVSPNSSGAGL